MQTRLLSATLALGLLAGAAPAVAEDGDMITLTIAPQLRAEVASSLKGNNSADLSSMEVPIAVAAEACGMTEEELLADADHSCPATSMPPSLSAFILAQFETAVPANSARPYAPGQQDQPANEVAPGQTDDPQANAPGQQKKAGGEDG